MSKTKVTVTITPPDNRLVRKPRVLEGKRYGPFSRLEDDVAGKSVPKFTTVFLLNQQAQFRSTSAFFTPPQSRLEYYHLWEYESEGLSQFSIGKASQVRKYSDEDTSVEYRRAWDRQPIPYATAGDHGLSVVFGSSVSLINQSNTEWTDYTPYITRDALLARQAKGEDVEQELADSALEIEEWEAAYESDFTFWIEPIVEWHRRHGYLKKKLIKDSQFRVDSTGPFEPFDPHDAVNFKVTEGLYSAPEVSVPKIRKSHTNSLVIGLVPRTWEFTVEYVGWYYQEIFDEFSNPVSRIWRHAHSFSGSMPAATSPLIFGVQGDNDPFGSAGPTTYDDVNVFTRTTTPLPSGLFSTPYSYESSPVSPGPEPVPSLDKEYLFLKMFFPGSDLLNSVIAEDDYGDGDTEHPGNIRRIFERSDSVLIMNEADLSAGDIVGLFELNGVAYYVYRKTPVVRGTVIYSGGITGAANTGANGTGLIFNEIGGYIKPYFVEDSRDFSYYDPTDIAEHLED